MSRSGELRVSVVMATSEDIKMAVDRCQRRQKEHYLTLGHSQHSSIRMGQTSMWLR